MTEGREGRRRWKGGREGGREKREGEERRRGRGKQKDHSHVNTKNHLSSIPHQRRMALQQFISSTALRKPTMKLATASPLSIATDIPIPPSSHTPSVGGGDVWGVSSHGCVGCTGHSHFVSSVVCSLGSGGGGCVGASHSMSSTVAMAGSQSASMVLYSLTLIEAPPLTQSSRWVSSVSTRTVRGACSWPRKVTYCSASGKQ